MSNMHSIMQSVITLIKDSRGSKGFSFPADVMYPNEPLEHVTKPYMKINFLSSVPTSPLLNTDGHTFLFQIDFTDRVDKANVQFEMASYIDTINKIFRKGTDIGGVAKVSSTPDLTIISPDGDNNHRAILTISLYHII